MSIDTDAQRALAKWARHIHNELEVANKDLRWLTNCLDKLGPGIDVSDPIDASAALPSDEEYLDIDPMPFGAVLVKGNIKEILTSRDLHASITSDEDWHLLYLKRGESNG